jgi:hypothetical protein
MSLSTRLLGFLPCPFLVIFPATEEVSDISDGELGRWFMFPADPSPCLILNNCTISLQLEGNQEKPAFCGLSKGRGVLISWWLDVILCFSLSSPENLKGELRGQQRKW